MFKNCCGRASLVVQWLGVHLPMQGTRVRALVWEDCTCRGAAGPVRHSCWGCALEPSGHSYWVRVSQLLRPAHLEPVFCDGTGHRGAPWWGVASARSSWRGPQRSNEDPMQPKKNQQNCCGKGLNYTNDSGMHILCDAVICVTPFKRTASNHKSTGLV